MISPNHHCYSLGAWFQKKHHSLLNLISTKSALKDTIFHLYSKFSYFPVFWSFIFILICLKVLKSNFIFWLGFEGKNPRNFSFSISLSYLVTIADFSNRNYNFIIIRSKSKRTIFKFYLSLLNWLLQICFGKTMSISHISYFFKLKNKYSSAFFLLQKWRLKVVRWLKYLDLKVSWKRWWLQFQV